MRTPYRRRRWVENGSIACMADDRPPAHEPTATTMALTYVECRARFRRAASIAGLDLDSRRLSGVEGRDGESLTIDTVHLGARAPRRALLVMSGVHGVEGFAGSAQQCDLLEGWGDDGGLRPDLADDAAIIIVHGVNPWGMSWWRRQNEDNVDLNRNWPLGTDRPTNEPYSELHRALCPLGTSPPDGTELLAELRAANERHGADWVRAAISGGQYSHPDGLYFGGDVPCRSTALLEQLVTDHLAGVDDLLIVDLHTGHGAMGTSTLLTRAPVGGPDDAWLRSTFRGERIESSSGDPDATAAPKQGQLSAGVLDLLAPTTGRSVTLELGTRSETRMIIVEHQEHWLHRHGARSSVEGRAIEWAHRTGSIPDDEAWQRGGVEHGRRVLGAAMVHLGRSND